jgi:beta-lactamase class D
LVKGELGENGRKEARRDMDLERSGWWVGWVLSVGEGLSMIFHQTEVKITDISDK